MSTAMATIKPLDNLSNAEGSAPKLLSQLENGITVPEGEPIHLDVRVASESEVHIDWLKDGRKLTTGSRVYESYDRGYASLDILYTHHEDTGMYSCVVGSRFGDVSTNPVLVTIIPEESQQYDTVAMQNEAFDMLSQRNQLDEHVPKQSAPPAFKTNIQCSNTNVLEGKPARFTCEITPADDAHLRVEWLKDEQPIVIGSRISSHFDRGYVDLEISYCFYEDSGSYKCVAFSPSGKVESQTINLTCEAAAKIVTDSNLSENSINHLKLLDEPGAEFESSVEKTIAPILPSFAGPIVPPQLNTTEMLDAYFEVPVDLGNGSKISIEWRHDGDLVHTGSRINGKLEMGMASLKFNYTQPQDSGNYVCCVISEHGKVESAAAVLNIEKTGTIIADSQLTGDRAGRGLIALQQLEEYLNAPRQEDILDDGPVPVPTILIQPKPVDEIVEGDTVKFQLQFEPATDPNVLVDWYKDGQTLCNGTRFQVFHERGIATLNLMYTIAEDSGTYWCHIANSAGTVDSDHLNLVCTASAAIITQSNLLEGSEGFKLIQEIEEAARHTGTGSRYADEVLEKCKPTIDAAPQKLEIIVGAPARFLVKMSGFPTPEIIWKLDGEPIVQDSITKVYSDGGISILEINKCVLSLGSHLVHVNGNNEMGQIDSEAELLIHPTDYKIPDLKHVAPENIFKKLMALKKVECTPELNKAFSKAKPTAKAINIIERDTEIKAKTYRSPEVVAAEEMLDKITHQLRTTEVNRQKNRNQSSTE